MIDAANESCQITNRHIIINLRVVAVIEYENDSTSDNKYVGSSQINPYIWLKFCASTFSRSS
jgi:hypothetical protein